MSSDDDLRWKLGTRSPGADYAIFKTLFVEGTHPRAAKPKRFSCIECVDWVNVIALTPDDKVVLVRQYRVGNDTVAIEIPGGMVDEGESPRLAAVRELEEETGYTSKSWHTLGCVAPNPAIFNNKLWSFLALDATPSGNQQLDSSEVIDLDLVPLAEVHQMLLDRRIDHALVVDAFAHLAFRLGGLRRPTLEP